MGVAFPVCIWLALFTQISHTTTMYDMMSVEQPSFYTAQALHSQPVGLGS